MTIDATDKRLLNAIADGLPLTLNPYETVADELGLVEDDVLLRLQKLIDDGVISRFGVVVRHHELGFNANAMAVWDVPDGGVGGVGKEIRTFPFVTLCYQRPRRLPDWPYNLFCMVHGRDRATVRQQIREINDACGLRALPQDVLFSLRRFKQCGAHYGPPGNKQREVA
ncbi:MAG: Lrp/AsnC family transcriptional regulator [Alphaproteobacteria bacterium]|jgi:siroheme decarboxylase|nr:Lrp/AsnC family transcriptional regulator [Alphaproteobacteria bacterium]